MPYLGPARAVFIEQRFGIFHPDPNPRPRISLIALTEKTVASTSRDRNESRRLPIKLEPKALDVILDAGFNATYAQDRTDAFESNGIGFGNCAGRHRVTS